MSIFKAIGHNKKNFLVSGSLVLLTVALVFFLTSQAAHRKIQVNVFYFSNSQETLLPEQHEIMKKEPKKMADEVLALVMDKPNSKDLVKVSKETVTVLETKLDDVTRQYTIRFSPEYAQLSPLEEQLFRSSFVSSLTQLSFVTDILIYVGNKELTSSLGTPLGMQNKSNVYVNPAIPYDKVYTQNAVLYFYDPKTQLLSPEERTIYANPALIERYIVEQLIAGPKNKELMPILPPETKIRGEVKIEDGVCYLNLSNDFIAKNATTSDAFAYYVYGIVNSLTELPKIKKVQFFFDYQRPEQPIHNIDFSKPLERNNIFMGNTPEKQSKEEQK